MKKNLIHRLLLYACLFIICTVMLFPFYWMLLISFRGPKMPSISFLPSIQEITLQSYKNIIFDMPFSTWFKNTLVVALTTAAFAVVLSAFSAYALSRFRFRGKEIFALGMLMTQMLPPVLLGISLFILLSKLRLLNTYHGLILAYLTLALPFSMWALWGYFESIPKDIEDAAIVDGCSRIGVLFRIVLPLAAPGIAAVFLFAFVLGWEQYLYPLLIMTSDSALTLTVGASRLASNQSIYWGELMAYGTLTVLPVTIIFVYLQKYIVQGLTAGALK